MRLPAAMPRTASFLTSLVADGILALFEQDQTRLDNGQDI